MEIRHFADYSAGALQPPLCAESGKIDARRRVPSARAIPSAELLRRFLVAVGNAKRRVAASVLRTESGKRRKLKRAERSELFAKRALEAIAGYRDRTGSEAS